MKQKVQTMASHTLGTRLLFQKHLLEALSSSTVRRRERERASYSIQQEQCLEVDVTRQDSTNTRLRGEERRGEERRGEERRGGEGRGGEGRGGEGRGGEGRGGEGRGEESRGEERR